MPRLLEAPVGHRRIVALVGVDPDGAGPQVPHGAVRPRNILRPDASGESVVGVVCDLIGLSLGVEGDDRHHRAEYLLPRDAHGVAHAGEDRWLVKIASLAAPGSAIDELCA